MRSLLILPMLVSTVFAGPATQPARYADQLARECDELLALAIKRPYGWAWTEQGGDEPSGRKTPKSISFAPGGTSAAGVILLWAGDLLNQPRYGDAARQAARGIAAAQLPSGKIPGEATFAGGISAKEAAILLPDRASTSAGLGLLLTLVERQGQQDEQVYRAASRAAAWLLKQQADSGAWPTLDPPGEPISKQSRIARLDAPDARDSTMAMLLAYEVLGDPRQRRSAEKFMDLLQRMRLAETSLWSAAYTPTGGALSDKRFPQAIDIAASRHAMQASVAVYMILGNGQNSIRAQSAAKALSALPHERGWWPRYTLQGDRFGPPATEPASVFGQPAEEPAPEDIGVGRTIKVVQTISGLDRKQWVEALKKWLSPTQVLAATISGAWDGDVPVDLPPTADKIPAYVESHPEVFKSLEGPPPAELRARVLRLWALYLRALIEDRLAASAGENR